MFFAAGEFNDPERELRDCGDELKAIVIRRSYRVSPEELWEALTHPLRVAQWYLPLAGDLREGGYYAFEGNAVGEIRRCERPRELELSWIYGEFRSDLWLRLWREDEATVLELEQSPIPVEMIPNPTPEMWGLATAWEMGLQGLAAYLDGRAPAGRAIDWLASATPDEMAGVMARGHEISSAWERLLGGNGQGALVKDQGALGARGHEPPLPVTNDP